VKRLVILFLTTGGCLGGTVPALAGATAFDLPAALASAATNAIFHVPAGVYSGPLTITQPVTLIAEPGAILQGTGQGTVVCIEAPDVTLRGFIIRNSGQHLSSEDSGILVKAPRACIESNRLDHVLFGIYLKQSPDSWIIGNQVRGYDLPLPVRGDGIRLWYSDRCVLAGNEVQNARDNILWFSKNDVIAQNRFTHDRYGLHLMYDDGLTITDNWLAENFVGAFLMYSRHVTFERNVCLNNRGISGYGLGIKNIDLLHAADNRILDNTVGLWMNSSPSALVTNLFRRNVVAYNSTGLAIDPSDRGNIFSENTFLNNSRQVVKDADGSLENVAFSLAGRGNYWSDYPGYPGANPAIGAIPYRVQDLFDSLTAQFPNLQLFRFSPAQEAIDLAAQAFPLIQPEVVLTDPYPLMTPPAIHAAPLPAQKSGALLAWSLALLAGVGVVLSVAETEGRWRSKGRINGRPVLEHGEKGSIAPICEAANAPQAIPPSPSAIALSDGAATALVVVSHLNKSFGRRQVLRDLTFSVSRGKAIAFWGGNGAGKSTTIKCLLGLLNFSGSIRVGGRDVIRQGKSVRALLGYVPQELSFYPDWTVRRTLAFCAQIKRVPPAEADAALAEVGLESHATQKVAELSGGMKQRLGLAAALLGQPAVLLLDEFTSNLDAEARTALLALLRRQRAKGLTVLFATHRLEEVGALADEVLVMEEGRIIRRQNAKEFVAAFRRAVLKGYGWEGTLHHSDGTAVPTSFLPESHRPAVEAAGRVNRQ
jgi:nitrous oxidase accessory protein